MTDPGDPSYLDEKSVRDELTRVFDHCHECRRCVEFCSTFPTLFDLIGGLDEPEAGRLTPVEQDRVVDQCFQCTLCSASCPYTPARHEWGIDLPRLLLRATAMRRANGQVGLRLRIAAAILGRTDRTARRAMSRASVVSAVARAKPDSVLRRMAASLTGVSSRRPIPPFTAQRFSTWFRSRPELSQTRRADREVTVFPTCIVEYQATQTGRDLVAVYEHNGVGCSLSSAGCCGAPWLHSGAVGRFAEIATGNVRVLADEIRERGDVVVPEPMCADVITRHYAEHVDPTLRADAELVARHTFDATGYLLRLHRDTESNSVSGLDTDFVGEVPARTTYHPAGPLFDRDTCFAAEELIGLTGAEVHLVEERSGVEALWSYRSDIDDVVMARLDGVARSVERAGGDIVVGDSHLSNQSIATRIGHTPIHPIRLIARAYGLGADEAGPSG